MKKRSGDSLNSGDVAIDEKFGTMVIMIDDCPRNWLFAEAYVVDNQDGTDIGDEVAITNTTGWRVVDNVGSYL